jgi:hypothetical protein
LTAISGSVPPPIGKPYASSAHADRAAPRQGGRRVGHTGIRPRLHSPRDCHRLCRGSDAAVPPGVAGGVRPPWLLVWRPRAWYCGCWHRPWPRPAVRHPFLRLYCLSPHFAVIAGIAAYQVAPHTRAARGCLGHLLFHSTLSRGSHCSTSAAQLRSKISSWDHGDVPCCHRRTPAVGSSIGSPSAGGE